VVSGRQAGKIEILTEDWDGRSRLEVVID